MKQDNPSRLVSLDVFRGLTIAGMILVNSPGNETAYPWLEHATWNGLTPTDWIFPFFVFIVGISLVFSLGRRLEAGVPRSVLTAQILQRTVIIFVLGLVLNGFPYYDLNTIRIPGVLQRIALCYCAASLFYIFSSIGMEVLGIIVLLAGYWFVMTHIAVPGFSVGDLSQGGNLAAYFDRKWLAGHLYRPVYDPEGLLSTLPAIGTALLGNLTGRLLKSSWQPAQKATVMVQAGVIFLLLGWKWNGAFPLNKALWTSSYVLVTAGLALWVFSALYYLIEIRGWKKWSRPLQAFGLNAIAVYMAHILFLKIQNRIHLPRPDGTLGNLRLWITDHGFRTWLSAPDASLAYALGYTLFWGTICWILYRRKIFIKL